MTGIEAAQRAAQLFEAGETNDEELLGHATHAWETFGPGEPGIAEVARFARIAAYRLNRAPELWQTRHISSATMSGAWRSLALSLQPYFYLLLRIPDFDAAEQVVVEMERLAGIDHTGPPTRDLLDGIVAERRGLLFTKAERWEEAARAYERARLFTTPGDRRALKVLGGLARSRWLAGGPAAEAAEVFRRMVSESDAFPDVQEAARRNLTAAEAGDASQSVSFDLD